MNIKTKFVSIEYDHLGKVKRVLPCDNLTEEEYNKLVNEQNEEIAKELEDKNAKESRFLALKEKVKLHDLFLAKATYDNFVDRGLIEEDLDFQNAWFDFIFNDKELETYPEQFVRILAKLGE